MKKMKLFAAGAALLMTTFVVFAGMPKTSDNYRIYGLTGTTWVEMEGTSNITFGASDEFQIGTSLLNPAVVSQGLKSYDLYYYDITSPHVGPVDAIVLQ